MTLCATAQLREGLSICTAAPHVCQPKSQLSCNSSIAWAGVQLVLGLDNGQALSTMLTPQRIVTLPTIMQECGCSVGRLLLRSLQSPNTHTHLLGAFHLHSPTFSVSVSVFALRKCPFKRRLEAALGCLVVGPELVAAGYGCRSSLREPGYGIGHSLSGAPHEYDPRPPQHTIGHSLNDPKFAAKPSLSQVAADKVRCRLHFYVSSVMLEKAGSDQATTKEGM